MDLAVKDAKMNRIKEQKLKTAAIFLDATYYA